MATYRELLFKLKKINSSKFNDEVISSLFLSTSNFNDKVALSLSLDSEVQNEEKLLSKIEEVKNGVPYQYVIGHTTFLKSTIHVDKNVLIPRQETEQLVLDLADFCKKTFQNKHISIIDIGTGSGCIAIELAKRINADISASDISKNALKVAKENANDNNLKIKFYESDVFASIPSQKFDVIVSNPPYILNESTVDASTLKYEPHLALFASPNTYFYERIFMESKSYLANEFILAFEIGEDMENNLTDLVKQYFPSCHFEFRKDIYNRIRFLYIICKQ